jgi:hypothetical protein
MFYFLVNKIYKKNLMKPFIIGSISYIILHAYLFSKNNENSKLYKLRNYLYYIFGVDIVVTGIYSLLYNNNIKQEITNEESEESQDSDITTIKTHKSINVLDNNNNKLEEIRDKLLKMKNNQLNNSPFIKKTEITKNIVADVDKFDLDNENKEEEKKIKVEEVSDTEIPLYNE